MADQQLFFINLQKAGVEGESTKTGHEKWMEAQSWHFSMQQSADHSVGQAAGTGTAALGSFSFERILDKASPKLFDKCSRGQHISDVQFDAERTGTQSADGAGTPAGTVYFTLVFRDVVITSRTSNHSDGDRAKESIGLAFGQVEMTQRQVMTDGSLGPNVTKKYDAKMNKATA